MDCFQKALEYLYQKALENNGLTGEVIVTKIEAEDEKGSSTRHIKTDARKPGSITCFFLYLAII